MNASEFEEFFNSVQEHERSTFTSKSQDYSSDDDKFFNFHQAAHINGIWDETTPEREAWGFATKHLISVLDIIHHRVGFDVHKAREKFGDLRIYLTLIEAMMTERYGPRA